MTFFVGLAVFAGDMFYDFYSYLDPFGHSQQLCSSGPPHSVPATVLAAAFHEFACAETN